MFSTSSCKAAILTILGVSQYVAAITVDVTSPDSIKYATSQIAYRMVQQYPGNTSTGIPGLLGDPYYWWEAGAMFGALIDYWFYTNDTSYNNITSQAMLFQTGADNDYMPINQTKSLGNDDQGFWALSAMRAAEVNYPNPPSGKPQWLALAQAVFNEQANRWDDTQCGGGLRWQIFTFNDGYNYRNSISNGCFFNLGARLGAYTGNKTYLDWAEKSWDWVTRIGLINDFNVYDGSDGTLNCTQTDHIQWTYNAGIYIYGAATMWNVTGDDKWKNRTMGLWTVAKNIFYVGNDSMAMSEVACEATDNCKTDQLSFKAYLSRWLAVTMQVAPFMEDSIKPYMIGSAQAAANSCVQGGNGVTCGTKWYASGYDGETGVGQQMCALESLQGLFYSSTHGPLSNRTGGTSAGDPAAGTGSGTTDGVNAGLPAAATRKITTGDRAGAVIITLMLLAGLGGWVWFLIFA